ncbi:MAG: chemotaxis-specific protein-glutamate methyltransferase CheB [Pirellulales bacterium]
MKKIRVMIVEDSRVVREFLESLIGSDPRLEVVASLDSAEAALRALHDASPDVISMDIRLPGMNGFEATQRIMAERPTPIVVVSASVQAEDLKVSMNALRAGALSVIEKPVGRTHRDYAPLAERLCTQLVLMSQVQVVRQRIRTKSSFPASNAAKSAEVSRRSSAWPAVPFRMLGLVASTGGPSALQQLLGDLGPRFPLPVVLVQHMTTSFMDGFVSWLAASSPLEIGLAKDGDIPKRGRVYVAPADRHLWVDATCLRLNDGPSVSAQRPSGTVLFKSLARSFGPRSLGVLLTGMGDDGAAGLKELRKAGAYTIAEDESTAVVYGMPGMAVRMEAACESLPLEQIGPRLTQLVLKTEEAVR